MFGMFDKKNNQKKMDQKIKQDQMQNHLQKEKDYSSLVEITGILTNGDAQALEDITLLAKDSTAFMEKYKVWCNDMLKDISDWHNVILVAIVYWLTGYSVEGFIPPCQYGAYIDWKEETEDILWNLEAPIQSLGYSIYLEEIYFTNQECTDEALQIINDYCVTKGYVLVDLDTDSDCYHLFIVKTEDFDKLVELGNEIGFKFSVVID